MRLVLFAAFMILCSSIVFAAVPATTVYDVPEGTNLKITLVNQDPSPAEPGGIVELRFKVENAGSTNAEDLVFELLPNYPFALYGDTAQRAVGSVWGRQQGNLGAMVSYRLKVDEGAVEGVNSIEARYKLSNSGWVKLYPFNVSIKTSEAIMGVESFYSEPGVISPGSAATVYVKLKNYGKSRLKDIGIMLNVSSSLPFVPLNWSNEQVINELKPAGSATVAFVVGAKPDAEADSYSVPLVMLYDDAGGRNYSKTSYIGLVVGSEPELLVQIDETSIYSRNSYGRVVVKFVNRGLNEIKLLTAELQGSGDYELISPGEVYVGKIDSDDYETAEFKLYVNDVKERAVLPLSIEYRDANNELHKEQHDLYLKIYSGSDAKKFGLVKGSRATGFFIVILIIVVGVTVYKMWWKRRKRK